MGKPLANLSPLDHRGATHIKVEIANNEQCKNLVRQVPGRKWSKTHSCWYVPYTTEAFRQLKALFEVTLPPAFPNHLKPPEPTEPSPIKTDSLTEQSIRIERENENRVKAFVPWQRKDWIEQIKTIPGRAWNEEGKYWSLPLTEAVILKMNDWFGPNAIWSFAIPKDIRKDYQPKGWKEGVTEKTIVSQGKGFPQFKKPSADQPDDFPAFPSPSEKRAAKPPQNSNRPIFTILQRKWGAQKIVTGEKIIVEQWDDNWLCAFVPGDKKGWLEGIKTIPGRKWLEEHLCWLLPITSETIRELDKFDGKTLIRNFPLSTTIPDRYQPTVNNRQTVQTNEMQRLALHALEERLLLEFKSHRTIKSYGNILKGLLLHYPDTKPSSISLKQINQYVVYKRKESQISSSYMNQIINAFNAFFGRVLGQTEKVMHLERPRKDRKLPNFISAEDMKKLLKASDNSKHKCMLILIYSAGLRKGELLNLRLRDLNVSAKCIFVKGGKGRKDRLTLYSPTAIKYVNEYLKSHKPSYWLFEGQTGDRYSGSSLQKVFERAKEKAGVNERLTIHGLRHSFATHLTYKGVPLHETKRLLGHESIKTTEVYLHLANRYKSEIQSPLEDLDI